MFSKKWFKPAGNIKLSTSIENILNENIVENARLELKKNWNSEPIHGDIFLI